MSDDQPWNRDGWWQPGSNNTPMTYNDQQAKATYEATRSRKARAAIRESEESAQAVQNSIYRQLREAEERRFAREAAARDAWSGKPTQVAAVPRTVSGGYAVNNPRGPWWQNLSRTRPTGKQAAFALVTLAFLVLYEPTITTGEWSTMPSLTFVLKRYATTWGPINIIPAGWVVTAGGCKVIPRWLRRGHYCYGDPGPRRRWQM